MLPKASRTRVQRQVFRVFPLLPAAWQLRIIRGCAPVALKVGASGRVDRSALPRHLLFR